MGNTRNSHLWYYAICPTRCTYNLHGISRFNGILHSGRGGNYQTSSIPSRLAPMRFLFEKKEKRLCLRDIEIISNNSMALKVRYEQTKPNLFLFFHNTRLCIEIVVWKKGYFRFGFWYYVSKTHFSVTNRFSYTPKISLWYLYYL